MWKKEWTKKEVQTLKDCYPFELWNSLLKLFPDRSCKSIRRKAEELNLVRGKEIRFKQMGLATKEKWRRNCFDVDFTTSKVRIGIKKRNQNGSKNPNWKGNKVQSKDRRLRNSIKLDKWKKSIFKRDNYICQMCTQRGGSLEVHHIKKWKKFRSLRYNINNGITLCKKDHKFIRRKEERYEKIFKKIIKGKDKDNAKNMGT